MVRQMHLNAEDLLNRREPVLTDVPRSTWAVGLPLGVSAVALAMAMWSLTYLEEPVFAGIYVLIAVVVGIIGFIRARPGRVSLRLSEPTTVTRQHISLLQESLDSVDNAVAVLQVRELMDQHIVLKHHLRQWSNELEFHEPFFERKRREES